MYLVQYLTTSFSGKCCNYVDDAVLVSQTQDGLRRIMARVSPTCSEFALTISSKKTKLMTQDAPIQNDPTLTVTENVRYLRFLISMQQRVSGCRDSGSYWKDSYRDMSKLDSRVWENKNLSCKAAESLSGLRSRQPSL